jgi:hypothetical protein
VYDDPCLAGPGEGFEAVAQLVAHQPLLVTGLSADEAWWTVDNPGNPGQSCWLARSRADFSGDIGTLPMVAMPEGSKMTLKVEITRITLDPQGRYVVEFKTVGFTPGLPGIHIHFFFDTFAAEQSGDTAGNRLMYGGASPFTDYTQKDRPAEATQLCALVADTDHTVIEGSGNCFVLP